MHLFLADHVEREQDPGNAALDLIEGCVSQVRVWEPSCFAEVLDAPNHPRTLLDELEQYEVEDYEESVDLAGKMVVE